MTCVHNIHSTLLHSYLSLCLIRYLLHLRSVYDTRVYCLLFTVFVNIFNFSFDQVMSHRRSGRGRGTTSLFIRNVSYDTKPEDLRKLFTRYGYVRDVYIPLDYYTREPRGFAYVEFEDARDASDSMEELDGYRFMDRELEIVFAEGDRKNPNLMRRKETAATRYGYGRRGSRSRSRSPRRRRRSRSPRRSRQSRSRSHTPGSKTPSRSRSRSRSQPRRSSNRRKSPTPKSASRSPVSAASGRSRSKSP